MDNVKDKIRKLLAKATSQNEHEAQAAMLKARELMAKHKLTEKDVADAKPGNRKLVTIEYADGTFSPNRNSWYPNLGGVIADNHCCLCVVSHARRSKVHTIKFIGIDDDPLICMEIFRYALQEIKSKMVEYKKLVYEKVDYQPDRNTLMKRIENGYAIGFAVGLQDQYEEQFKDQKQEEVQSMALVMVKPQEVLDLQNTMKESNMKMSEQPDPYAMREGKVDGYRFQITKQLTEATV